MLIIEVDGAPATTADVHRVATFNYGHFTSMQVRDRAVRGLDRHLARLGASSAELFDLPVEPARARALINHALPGGGAASVRVNVFSKSHVAVAPPGTDAPSIMVSVSDPVSEDPQPPWRVRAIEYQRELAHVKHVATMGLIRQRRLAALAGYHDVQV